MNLNQMMAMTERLSDQQLAGMMRESEVIPDFIVASELQRRKDMRAGAMAPQPTVAESLMQDIEAEEYAKGGHISRKRGSFTDSALRYMYRGDGGVNQGDDNIDINPMEDFGVSPEGTTSLREQSMPSDMEFYDPQSHFDLDPGEEFENVAHRRRRRYAAGGRVGEYVGAPAGYRPGFDAEYDGWRRRGYGWTDYPVTQTGAGGSAGSTGANANANANGQQGAGVGEGLGALAISTGLGLLPKLPDIYRGVRDLFGGEAGTPDPSLPLPPEFLTEQQAAGLWGSGTSDLPLPPDFLTEAEAASLFDLPGADLYADAGAADGFAAMGVSPDDFVSVSDVSGANAAGVAGASPNTYLGGALDLGAGYDFGLTGSLGSLPGIGDVATGAVNLGAGYLGSLASQGTVNPYSENSGYGHKIGSTIGGIIGSFIPVPGLGTFVGSTLGGVAGSAIGNEVGAPPTVGRNFGVSGSFGQDGNLTWSGAGGDNGGTADDATTFANWLNGTIRQRATEQGLSFNPNMAGAQVTVGGFDNPTRGGVAPGGYFYTAGQAGASPENYALRPNPGMGAYSPEQANAFAQAVLADLTARDVFTSGASDRDVGYFNSTLGADLGGYGYQTWGQQDTPTFADNLAQRQGAIGGWAQRQQQEAAMEAQARDALAQNNRWADQDTSGISAQTLLAAQTDPALASMYSLGGLQWDDSGVRFADQQPNLPYDPGGA